MPTYEQPGWYMADYTLDGNNKEAVLQLHSQNYDFIPSYP